MTIQTRPRSLINWSKLSGRWSYLAFALILSLLGLAVILLRELVPVQIAPAARITYLMMVGIIWSRTLEARLVAIEMPKPVISGFCYFIVVVVVCEEVGRASETGLLLTPLIFLLLQIPIIALTPRRIKNEV